MANFDHYRITTTEPIATKFSTIDYVHEIKFGTNPSTGGFLANGRNITLLSLFYLFIYTFFSETRAQVRPVDGFLRAIGQKTWNHARMCLLGVMKLKFNAKPIFIPHNRQFLAQNGTVFFDRKCLTTHSIQRLSASKRKYRKTQQYNAKWQVAREA